MTRIIREIPQDNLLYLNSPVRYAKGVGEKKANILSKLGIESIGDLLWHFPLYYEDRSKIVPIEYTTPGKRQVIQGKIILVGKTKVRRNLTFIKVPVRDRSGTIFAIWYNQDYLLGVLKRGQEIVLSGRVHLGVKGEKQIGVEDWEILKGKDEDHLHLKRIVPIYPLTEGVSQRFLRRVIKNNLDERVDNFPDSLPAQIRKVYSLVSFPEAIKNIHFPQDFLWQKQARRRLVFEELFLLQIALALKRRNYRKERGIKFTAAKEMIDQFINHLSFSLTLGQRKVINEILQDMGKEYSMNRLLQGDVGSGKTLVAVVAILNAIGNNYQAALMTPTEILSQQHYLRIKRMLSILNVRPTLLISELPAKEKKQILKEIKEGQVKLIIGTHALIQKEVTFRCLGLVVIDEQHRFGVRQRASLRAKGAHPDVLIMTATPIPRTLALTSYGDLDLSVIDELPPGRKPVITRWVAERRQGEVYQFLRAKLKKGFQAYFVCPIIEESTEMDLRPALEMAKKLQENIFPEFKVGLLHGRMSREEKNEIMTLFEKRRIDILVSTSVIEVGIDIPKALLIVIENAERFGLAQLHQLRGRVGRAADQSYCFLITGSNMSREATRRMKVMCGTNDGFRIAEEDLVLRGPGEFFGTRQWGIFDLKIADLLRDSQVLLVARKEAFNLVKEHPDLEGYPLIKQMIKWRFSSQTEGVS